MAWLAVDKDGTECIYDNLPKRSDDYFKHDMFEENAIVLPQGSIKKLIGRDLTWEDDPVEI